jgi:cytochrome c oxidase assembly factor CtaG
MQLQHLVLHHVGPFLLVLAAPARLMSRGLPRGLRERMLRPLWRNTPVQALYRFLQHPVVAPLLFVGLVYFSMHRSVLYDVYGICGRAWATGPLVDQELGGMLTWIPPAMMSVIGILVVLGQLLHDREPELMEHSVLAESAPHARSES